MKRNLLLLTIALASGCATYAQTKIKDGTIVSPGLSNANAILELESANKGLLLPRVALEQTSIASPLNAHIAGMVVYNTATAGDVLPGYYYNDGSQWVKASGGSGGSTEPWNVQGGSTPANANSENIYQTGNVSIGKNSSGVGSSTLQVYGSVSTPIRSVTQSVVLTEEDYTVVCRQSSAITISLPDPATCLGRMYYIINNGTQPVTTNYPFEVATGVNQSTIPVAVNGINSPNPNFGQKYLLQSDGTKWVLISLG
ncbi:hypothetical protein GCM10010967_56550 [Dyadobacter beijingensis]|uniref:Uncharacterized protein n=1 Tax=Dyadobacter beijingensis TaxID=365489 RepID=A0ABQ2INU3_9BACT|nr:hypothetical protein [Dyadobacter beijingensis]GGN13114.1 hypothetical protein GCM10010967_56550 [Dyadobacter beijingensis]